MAVSYRIIDFSSDFPEKDSLINQLVQLQRESWAKETDVEGRIEIFKRLIGNSLCAIAEDAQGPVCAIYFTRAIKDSHSHRWIYVLFIGRKSILKVVFSGALRKCFEMIKGFAKQENAGLCINVYEGNKKMISFVSRAGFSLLTEGEEALSILQAFNIKFEDFTENPPSFKLPNYEYRMNFFILKV